MPGPTNNTTENQAYIDTGAFNSTIITGIGAALTAFGGGVVAIVKAAGVNISEPIMIAVLGLIGLALLALAIIVAADVLARSRVKVALINYEVVHPSAEAVQLVTQPTVTKPPVQAAPANGSRAVTLHIYPADGDTVSVGG